MLVVEVCEVVVSKGDWGQGCFFLPFTSFFLLRG
jgi:hypothetical protein